MMVSKIRILGMVLVLNSLGLILASLFTYKWYVDEEKEVGIFGLCEFKNKTSAARMIYRDSNTADHLELIKDTQKYPTSSLINLLKQRLTISIGPYLTEKSQVRTIDIFDTENIEKKCTQILWPKNEEAYKYLESKTDFSIST